MPTPLMRSLAEQYGVSLSTVERAWKACKDAIRPSSTGQDGYGIVVNCVKAKLRKGSHRRATAAVREKMS
jgi:DNA-binding transcriptional regulator YhcF (GntR family)